MKRITGISFVLVLSVSPCVLGQTAEEKGRQIAMEARERDTGFGDTSAELVMILRGRGGDEKRRELRSMALEVRDDGNKSVVVFESPPDVKGTALLTYAASSKSAISTASLPFLADSVSACGENRVA